MKPKTLEKFTNLIWNSSENICFSPYKIGDILWVRETWAIVNFKENELEVIVCYKAGDIEKGYTRKLSGDEFYKYYNSMSESDSDWKPSIHMPRSTARIFLEVTDVRVERLQDITTEDVRAEGIRGWTKDGNLYKYGHIEPGDEGSMPWRGMPKSVAEAFKNLWDSTYSKRGHDWEKNDWVWVIEFKLLEGGNNG